VVETWDANANPINSFFKAGQAVLDMGTIDLTGSTYEPTVDAMFSYTNLPASVQSVQTEAYLSTATGYLVDRYLSISIASGAGMQTIKRANVPGASALVASRFNTSMSFNYVVDWGPAASAYSLDATGQVLSEYATDPALDPAAHSVRWTNQPGGIAPDFVVTNIRLSRDTPVRYWQWQIAAPSSGTIVVLPVLPGDAAVYNATAADISQIGDFATAKVPGGYDAIRANVHAFPDGPQAVVQGATGRALAEFLLVGKARTTGKWDRRTRIEPRVIR
jgi:hypothetical protein